MRKFILLLALLFSGIVSAQIENKEERVKIELISSEDGLLHRYVEFDTMGELLQEGYYLDGKPHGAWKMYNADGSISLMEFKEGKRIVMHTVIDGRRTKIFYDDNRPVSVVINL